jgi:hypothetical protein
VQKACRKQSFRGAGAAREPGTYARRLALVWPKPVCMDSGSGPAGHPGMTLCVPTYEILLSTRRSGALSFCEGSAGMKRVLLLSERVRMVPLKVPI